MNHLDLVGWISTARYKWAEFTGRGIKFKPATFYLGVADHLARHVEGQTTNENENAKRGRSGQREDVHEGSATKSTGEMTESSQAGAGVALAESGGSTNDSR